MYPRVTAVVGVLSVGAAIAGAAGCPSDSSAGPSSVDTDGDGISDADELYVHGTSPLMKDTDGDGFDDHLEIVELGFDPAVDPLRFNPRVADFPHVGVIITSPPTVALDITDAHGATRMVEASEARTVAVTDTAGASRSQTRSSTRQVGQAETVELGVSRELAESVTFTGGSGDSGAGGAGGSADGAGGRSGTGGDEDRDAGAPEVGARARDRGAGGSGGAESRAVAPSVTLSDAITRARTTSDTTEASRSLTDEVTFAFTREQAVENADTLTRADSLARSNEIVEIGGVLKTTVVVQNLGHVTFRVRNLMLGAYMLDEAGTVVPVANLAVDNQAELNPFQPFTVAPGEETGPMTFSRVNLTLPVTRELLVEAQALIIRVVQHELTNIVDMPFAFGLDAIAAKTATIDIDYAGRRHPEIYRVAAKLDPAHPGVTAGTALGEILRVPFDAPRERGLTSVRGIAAGATGAWTVEHIHDDAGGATIRSYGPPEGPYDFQAIELAAGDTLHLAYVDHFEAPTPRAIDR